MADNGSSFDTTPIAPGIVRVGQALGPRQLYFYVLDDGDGLSLFDTGLPGSVTGWLDQVAEQRPIKQVILSHADADHLGGTAEAIERFPHVQALAHADDRRWMEHHDQLVAERYDGARPRFGMGYPADTLKALRGACGNDFALSGTVAAGDVIRAAGRSWTVLHTPGHSPGHLALWSADEGLILLGDAILGAGIPAAAAADVLSMPPTHQYIQSYLSTLDMLATYPVRCVLSGHWPALDHAQFHELLAESRSCVQRDLAFVSDTVTAGSITFSDLNELLNERFGSWPSTENVHYFYALLGYIDYLEDRSEITVTGDRIERRRAT